MKMKSFGLRENCEDVICSDCKKYIDLGNYEAFKKCKKDCMVLNRDKITSCCTGACAGLPASALLYCQHSCKEMMYGGASFALSQMGDSTDEKSIHKPRVDYRI